MLINTLPAISTKARPWIFFNNETKQGLHHNGNSLSIFEKKRIDVKIQKMIISKTETMLCGTQKFLCKQNSCFDALLLSVTKLTV